MTRSRRSVNRLQSAAAAAGAKEKAAIQLRGHVIPNSHLDREWTLEYQQTRRLTVEFIDRLLDILDQAPEYTFLLDSQTVPLEDYLEIRPENEDRVRRACQSGRMLIGPWYTAPDPHQLCGESIVRNLLRGHRTADRFGGRPMKVGYTPFGFGQVSQLPQIYAGFGIDMVFFYRTIHSSVAPQSEFVWEGPDGTRALCSRFGPKPRYNFFMDVWRPVVYGRAANERMYKWRQGDLPFKRVGPDREWDHYFILRPKKELHLDLLETSFRAMLEEDRQHFSTPIIPLMQGMDTTMPDPLEAEIVRELQQYLQPGEEVFFSTLEAYAEDLRAHLDVDKLRVLRGEMRHPEPGTPWTTTLEHIGSSRPRQKVAHSRAENALVRVAEPFAAAAWMMGALPYPKSYLDLAWRYLFLTHPHDTVGGTGVDKLETDTLYRLDQVKALSDVVIDDALGALQTRIDNSGVGEDEIVLTVFNPTARPRTEVVEAYLDIPKDSQCVEFEIVDSSGRRADYHYVLRKPGEKTVRDNTDLTTALVCWTTKVYLRAEDVPPLGWRTYVARPVSPGVNRMDRVAISPTVMENEHLRIEFDDDGTFALKDKATGHTYEDLHSLVDQGERGSGWESRAAHSDAAISSIGAPISIALVENTALSATIRVRYAMRVPAGVVHNDSWHYTERTAAEVDLPVESFFTLRRGARRLDVRTVIDNWAKNHKLRVCFPTGLAGATHSAAETPYDVIEREIVRGPEHPYCQTTNPNYPFLRFVDVSDGKRGLSVITKGLHEFEVTEDASRALMLTLLRAYEVTLCTVSYRWERRPDQELSQALGTLAVEYSLVPHAGNWEAGEIMREADDFFTPLVAAQTSRGEGDAPRDASLVGVKPATLVMSAIKKAEDRDSLIVRLFNPSGKKQRATITFARNARRAALVNFNEEPLADAPKPRAHGRVVSFDIGGKSVQTVEVEFA